MILMGGEGVVIVVAIFVFAIWYSLWIPTQEATAFCQSHGYIFRQTGYSGVECDVTVYPSKPQTTYKIFDWNIVHASKVVIPSQLAELNIPEDEKPIDVQIQGNRDRVAYTIRNPLNLSWALNRTMIEMYFCGNISFVNEFYNTSESWSFTCS